MSGDRTAMGDLVAALGSLQDPAKDGKVSAGQRQYRYLELTDLLAEVRTKFAAHGWAITQVPDIVDGHVSITNTWLHQSGEVMAHPPFTLPCGRSPQDIGSAITYARRYSLAALVGLAGSDDDDAQTVQAELTRPVERVKQRATDPDPWQTAPPQRPPQPPAHPVPPQSQPDAGAPSTRTLASGKQTKYLWTLLRQSGMTDQEVRPWVQSVLSLDSPDWHTTELTSAQVSQLIERLKADTPPEETP